MLDEPTNHLDLESIEALVGSLQTYQGTLILVSHDRWFVGELASRIVEIRPDEIQDYEGTYEEYVHFCGDDHLDVDTVVLKAQQEHRKAKVAAADRRRQKEGRSRGGSRRLGETSQRRLVELRDQIAGRIEKAESQIAAIEGVFSDPDLYAKTRPPDVGELQDERERLVQEIEELMEEWEAAEAKLLE